MSDKETSTIFQDGERVQTKLELITQRARENPKMRFTSLAHHLNEGFLLECFQELKKNKAPGIDGVTVEKYEERLEENLKDLVARLKGKQYRPQPVRRVYIPKDEKSVRPLGIPTVEDKIVQMGIKKILEAIYEQDFVEGSYGFRPKRGCHDALEVVDKTIMTKAVNFVVDMDIEKFFDTVEYKWMMKCLEQRIADPSFLRLIGRFLKAGIMEDGVYQETDKGTPQGGVISPVLANIYLHYVLDLWFEKVVKRHVKGYASLTRYADDFIACFEKEEDAKRFGGSLRLRMGKFGLKVSEEKSKIIEFGRKAWQRWQEGGEKVPTFNFLGFTYYCENTRKGSFKVGRKTNPKKMRAKLKAMNQWLKSIRNAVEFKEWWPILKQKLIGHYRYYGISGNMRGIRIYYSQCVKLAYKWVNRRSQKKSFNWEKYRRLIYEWNPLPQPKIYHLTYTLSSKRKCY